MTSSTGLSMKDFLINKQWGEKGVKIRQKKMFVFLSFGFRHIENLSIKKIKILDKNFFLFVF